MEKIKHFYGINGSLREKQSLSAPDFPNNIPYSNPPANAMQNYTHHYQYDKLGNMLQDAWKQNEYDSVTNRLLGHDGLTNQYTYDAHGNMLTIPHLSNLSWDYLDQLISAGNGTFTSYYNYDSAGSRTRKVVIKGNIIETRYYIGGYEVYRKEVNGNLDTERTTLNISDDEKVFVRVEQKTGENPLVRYQYDNHLGSASLELDDTGQIISYEEYHPFGTTSYRSGRSETEVSLKRYKYCGKERDEETGLYYYGMRYYAAWICRFVSVDPLQFKYPYYTPYQYASNRCVSGIDLDGAEFYYNPDGSFLRRGKNSTNNDIFIEEKKLKITYEFQPAIDRVARQVGKPTQVAKSESKFEYITTQTKIAPWLSKAFEEMNLGVKEGTKNDNTSPVKYLNYEGVPKLMRATKESVAWCAAFVNYVLEESGFTGESANPLAVENWNGTWRTWDSGDKIDKPSYGALVTFGDTHIGFVVGMSEDGKELYVLGGNQNNEVNVSKYPIKDNFEYFLPKDYKPRDFENDEKFLKQSYQGTIKNGGSTR
jgi:uncharacterized protein (TIGR02594 family)